MTLAGVLSLVGGLIAKYLSNEQKQNEKALRAQYETNNQLERLNTNMEHQFKMYSKDINNNFDIVDNNFVIINGELVEIRKAVFQKDKGNPLPLRKTEEI